VVLGRKITSTIVALPGGLFSRWRQKTGLQYTRSYFGCSRESKDMQENLFHFFAHKKQVAAAVARFSFRQNFLRKITLDLRLDLIVVNWKFRGSGKISFSVPPFSAEI